MVNQAVKNSLVQLRERLSDASKKLKEAASQKEQIKSVALALNAVIDFTHAEAKPEDAHPLLMLLGALADISEGNESKLLEPIKKLTGRRKGSTSKKHVLAVASAVMTLFIDAGEMEENAARKITRVAMLPFERVRTSREDWKILVEWRSKLIKMRHEQYAYDLYLQWLRKAKEQKYTPQKLLDALIKLTEVGPKPEKA